MISGLGVPMSFVIPSMILGLLKETPKVPTVEQESPCREMLVCYFWNVCDKSQKNTFVPGVGGIFFIYIFFLNLIYSGKTSLHGRLVFSESPEVIHR